MHFHDLDQRARWLAIAKSAARTVLSIALLFGVYAVLPVENVTHAAPGARLVVGIAVVVAALLWQLRRIRVAAHPVLRAVEAVAFAVPLFIVVFSVVYPSLSTATPASFSERLDRTSAVYYTVSVLSTVGFGDISAKTDAARNTLTLRMLLDLALLAGIVRVLFGTAQVTVTRQSGS